MPPRSSHDLGAEDLERIQTLLIEPLAKRVEVSLEAMEIRLLKGIGERFQQQDQRIITVEHTVKQFRRRKRHRMAAAIAGLVLLLADSARNHLGPIKDWLSSQGH